MRPGAQDPRNFPDVAASGTRETATSPILRAAATRTLLVGEITAPHTAVIDHVLKPHLYAAAGIPWYLLVEQESPNALPVSATGFHYVQRSATRAGEVLEPTEPVRAAIPEELLP